MLAHSLLSRNKSDCQTDYKLRNFGNRNYLHAITKIQLNSVGVKISKMKKIGLNKKMSLNKETIAKLNDNQMTSLKGGSSEEELAKTSKNGLHCCLKKTKNLVCSNG